MATACPLFLFFSIRFKMLTDLYGRGVPRLLSASTIPIRKGGRVVYGARLESVCGETHRGFKSHPFRFGLKSMLFDIFKAVILGIVEGATEFLPISSTGHLIIVNQWLSLSGDVTKIFDIVIQGGAIVAVFFFFYKQLIPIGKNKGAVLHIWVKALIGTIPALILGVIAGESVQKALFHPFVVSVALIIGGIALIVIERTKRVHSIDSIRGLTYPTVILIGIIQCLAFIPGISRSSATMLGAMMLGASRKVSAEFSFFLAIPTILAAGVYSLIKSGMVFNGQEVAVLVIGSSVSFCVAWAVTALFMKYIKSHSFEWFGYYRIVLGMLVAGLLLFRVF